MRENERREALRKAKGKRDIFSITALILILLFTGGLVGSSHPSFCKSCHIEKPYYQSWKESPHNEMGCLSCHQEPGVLGFCAEKLEMAKRIISNTLRSYRKPVIGNVSNASCLKCHEWIQKKLAIKKGIRVSHREFLEKAYKCIDCHSTVAHGEVSAIEEYPHMDKCTPCHNKRIAPTTCEICHVKGAERTVRYTGPWAVTHGPKWEKTHGMGNLTSCIVCHEEEKCTKCHVLIPHPENWPYLHGKNAREENSNCDFCHIKSFCENCHQIEMPHPEEFLPVHADELKEVGEKICLHCHAKSSCDLCHTKHAHPGLRFTPP
ncbi:MAG: NapC/NirT family cytochrome c [Actinomycetota bacterium]|nr:NapC/NirT family cytochrome c [Actinomycetota bacterium]